MSLLHRQSTLEFDYTPDTEEPIGNKIVRLISAENLHDVSITSDTISFELLPFFQRFGVRRRNPLGYVTSGDIRISCRNNKIVFDYQVKYHLATIWGPILIFICFFGIIPAIVPEKPSMIGMLILFIISMFILMLNPIMGRNRLEEIIENSICADSEELDTKDSEEVDTDNSTIQYHSVEEIYDRFKSKFNPSNDFFLKPNFNEKKLTNARESYIPENVTNDKIIILTDATVLGGAKQGVCLTEVGLYCRGLGEKYYADLRTTSSSEVKNEDGDICIEDNRWYGSGVLENKENFELLVKITQEICRFHQS